MANSFSSVNMLSSPYADWTVRCVHVASWCRKLVVSQTRVTLDKAIREGRLASLCYGSRGSAIMHFLDRILPPIEVLLSRRMKGSNFRPHAQEYNHRQTRNRPVAWGANPSLPTSHRPLRAPSPRSNAFRSLSPDRSPWIVRCVCLSAVIRGSTARPAVRYS